MKTIDERERCDTALFSSHFKFWAVSWYMPENPISHRGWEMEKSLQF